MIKKLKLLLIFTYISTEILASEVTSPNTWQINSATTGRIKIYID